MKRRVVVTGMALTTPIGSTVTSFWQAALAGQSGIRRIDYYDPSEQPTQIGGQVTGLNLWRWPEYDKPRRFSRAARFALACSRLALEDAGLEAKSQEVADAGTYLGTGQGGGPESEVSYSAFYLQGWRRMPALTVTKAMPNSIANYVAIESGLGGPNVTIANACASSAEAASQAFEAIRSGRLDLALSGGAESMLFESMMAAWCQLRVMSQRNDAPQLASRPFDRDRDGMVMAEGAAMLVLEEESRARARGAKIYAEVLGAASGCDAHHITAPSVIGQSRTMHRALQDADVEASRVDFVSAHGTSTRLNDVAETKSLKEVLGQRAYDVPVSALKSMIGHSLGASGAIQLVATTMAIHDGRVHPTINLENPDPECDLDYVPSVARKVPIEVAMSNHFAFGGANTVLILGRHA
ncbi:MAG: beta-ketoacyl-[acyl-carrier-protein] synthase family protein [Planctomycetota bacterium]